MRTEDALPGEVGSQEYKEGCEIIKRSYEDLNKVIADKRINELIRSFVYQKRDHLLSTYFVLYSLRPQNIRVKDRKWFVCNRILRELKTQLFQSARTSQTCSQRKGGGQSSSWLFACCSKSKGIKQFHEELPKFVERHSEKRRVTFKLSQIL